MRKSISQDMSIFDRLDQGVRTSTPEESQQLAAEIAAALPDEAILTLEGDLGAGKTTFVKGLARQWKIAGPVTSPTFNIFSIYHGDRALLHMDAYRLDPSSDAIDELMLEDFMNPPYCLAIEWPSHLGELPWPATLALHFEIAPDQSRLIRRCQPKHPL